jgi:hypothetical protein
MRIAEVVSVLLSAQDEVVSVLLSAQDEGCNTFNLQ